MPVSPRSAMVNTCGHGSPPASRAAMTWRANSSGAASIMRARSGNHGILGLSLFSLTGKIMVFMNKLIAFAASTGERLWTNELSSPNTLRYHGTPVAISMGGTDLAILPSGHIVRLSDGKFIRDKGPEIGKRPSGNPFAGGHWQHDL